MKFTKSLLAMAFTGLLFVGCKESAAAPETTAAENETETSTAVAGKTETASFNIEGMSCSVGCAKTIEKKLTGLDGVQKASVNFEDKTAIVQYDASKQSPEKFVEIVEAVADGKTYKVSNVKSSGDKAMVYGDPVKEKDKKKKKAKKGTAAEEKKAAGTDDKSEDKPKCCAAKKACHSDEKGTL